MHTEPLTINGLTLNVRPETTDKTAAIEVIKAHVYDRGSVTIEPSDVWLDAGSYIGSFSLLAASKGASVVAVEPHPDNIAMLKQNVSGRNVEVIEAAVAVAGGEAALFVCNGDKNKYRHTLATIRGRESIRVRVMPIQPLLDRVNAVKLDIEGSEIEVLEVCDFSAVRKLVFEYHFDRCRSIPRFLAICERLRGIGFTVEARQMPDRETYDFYPAATIVRCSQNATPSSPKSRKSSCARWHGRTLART
ncbi:MAG: FkbM family methyltransferase [Caulobacteraceae bacterium]|nr:FkbM family methyltransferase [Caulobacteraceae bacterium]